MNPLRDFNKALDFLEEGLEHEIDYGQLAALALCGEQDFRRTFSYLAGMSVAEYIRLRRLSLAALELQTGSSRVLDLAIKYGYGSADAFSRAFQAVHGVSPSQARSSKVALKVFPRLSFRLTLKGATPMKVRIVEKPSFQIVGLKKKVSLVHQGVNPEIAEMWESLTPEDISRLKEASDVEPQGLISATIHLSDGYEEGSPLEHYIGAATAKKSLGDYAVLSVKACSWSVFESVGPFPDTLQEIWGRIYSEWFPSAPFEQASGPSLLWNEHKDTSSPTFRSEIWIPVRAR